MAGNEQDRRTAGSRHALRHRSRHALRHRSVIAAGAAVAVAATAGGAWAFSRDDSPCPGGTVDLAAAPEIAGVLQHAARLVGKSDGSCGQVTVRAADPASVAADLRRHGPRPDLWVPDSSIWLAQAGTPAGTSIAQSPVVLAAPGSGALDAGTLLRRYPLRLHLADPARSAPTALGLRALQATLAGQQDVHSRLAVLLRGAVRTRDLPLPAMMGAAADPAAVVPLSEQAVWSSNTGAGGRRLAAAYPRAGAAVLDYPLAVLDADRQVRTSADRLSAMLGDATGRRLLFAAGLRTAGGAAAPSMATALGQQPPPLGAARPAPTAPVAAAVRAVQALTMDSRILAVLDVSGSVARRLPQAGGRTGLDVLKEAAATGLNLFPDASEVGLWYFARELRGHQDYRELVPIAPLDRLTAAGNQRTALAAALRRLQPAPAAGTALYDTALAAVRTVRRSWQPGMVNSVVLLSDGRNDDPRGLGIGDLVTTLIRENDPRRPVPVITILIGADGDTQAMRAISAATGGTSYTARRPASVGRVFLDAIGRRACRPGC